MPTNVPVPDKTSGDLFSEAMWDLYIKENVNKLLSTGHRVLTVAQFAALTAPEDGDEVYLEVDATNGIVWHLRFVAAETTFKWRFLGGAPMVSEVQTAEATGSLSYVSLTTAGPSVALPRSGDYDVQIGMQMGAGMPGFMSFDVGGASAVDADNARGEGASHSSLRRKAGLGLVTLTAKYKSNDGTARTFLNRRMAVWPVRIRHDA